jgi:hypothetical protein
VPGAPGETIAVRIDGASGGTWRISRAIDGWRFTDAQDTTPAIATTTIPEDLAWRVFTKGISPETARERVVIEGDEPRGAAVLRMIAIVG